MPQRRLLPRPKIPDASASAAAAAASSPTDGAVHRRPRPPAPPEPRRVWRRASTPPPGEIRFRGFCK
uniref:Uncharacterized protein n=1 Tax=Oryza meridionalis TaxID=40149 RepID=A0A0E0EZL6_9ORYZ